ncbi:TPM domain-containing protein [Niabella terrae]
MGFSLFAKKTVDFLSSAEKEQIIEAIRKAESRTSGEIRVYMERHCKYVDPMDRAAEIFFNLKMDQTRDRNAVLLYIAIQDHQLALYGDSGIYERTGRPYWETLVAHILRHFDSRHFADGISNYIAEIGEGLHQYFPYDRAEDQNELPDEIVFGH